MPARDRFIVQQTQFFAHLLEVNRSLRLTSITSPLEVAIKHCWDAVAPRHEIETADSVLDLGSGGGIPGIPLACLFPEKRFLLVESVRKRAAFLSEAVERLGLENVSVRAERGEEVLKNTPADVLVARAVGSPLKLLTVLGKRVGACGGLLLYRGSNAAAELEEAADKVRQLGLEARLLPAYELPAGLGTRQLLTLTQARKRRRDDR